MGQAGMANASARFCEQSQMNSSAVKVLRPCTPLSLLDRRGNMTVLHEGGAACQCLHCHHQPRGQASCHGVLSRSLCRRLYGSSRYAMV